MCSTFIHSTTDYIQMKIMFLNQGSLLLPMANQKFNWSYK